MRYSPLILIGIIFLLLPADAWAVLTEKGILDSVLENYQSATKQWSRTIQNHATTLFLYLDWHQHGLELHSADFPPVIHC